MYLLLDTLDSLESQIDWDWKWNEVQEEMEKLEEMK